jgi:hypothetical protein
MNLELIKPIFKALVTVSISGILLVLAYLLNQDTSINKNHAIQDKIDALLILSLQLHLQQLHYRNDCNEQIIKQLDEYGKADFPCVIPEKYDENKQKLQKIQWKLETLEEQLKDETK